MYFVELFLPCLKSVNLLNLFCYVHGEFTPELQGKSITPIVKKEYELCIDCKVWAQDELGITFMLQ
jgi:hypothetical protein